MIDVKPPHICPTTWKMTLSFPVIIIIIIIISWSIPCPEAETANPHIQCKKSGNIQPETLCLWRMMVNWSKNNRFIYTTLELLLCCVLWRLALTSLELWLLWAWPGIKERWCSVISGRMDGRTQALSLKLIFVPRVFRGGAVMCLMCDWQAIKCVGTGVRVCVFRSCAPIRTTVTLGGGILCNLILVGRN